MHEKEIKSKKSYMVLLYILVTLTFEDKPVFFKSADFGIAISSNEEHLLNMFFPKTSTDEGINFFFFQRSAFAEGSIVD